MFLVIKLFIEVSVSGKFTANFSIFENNGPELKIIPYYLDKEFDNKDEAYNLAKREVLSTIMKKYPQGTKYKIENKETN